VSDDLTSTSDSFTVLVTNVAPVLSVGTDQTSLEGSLVSLEPATFIDPGAGSHWASINWGDGSVEDVVSIALGDRSIFSSHVYADDGAYTVDVVVHDDAGTEDSDSFEVVVGNIAPVLDSIASQHQTLLDLMSVGPVTFTDAGTADTHTATVDWGDGTPVEQLVVVESPSASPGSTTPQTGTVFGSHTFDSNGFYYVTVTLNDDDGGVSTQVFHASVDRSRSLIQWALDSMQEFEGESKHIGHAEKKLAQALEDRNWIDEVHADLKRGQVVFSHAASAVSEYEKALKDHAKGKKGTLSPEALSAIRDAINDIRTAITILTETRMKDTSGLIAVDSNKQSKVDSEIEKAINEYDDAMNKIAIGDIDKGIRELAKAWNHSNHAEKHALEEPKAKKGKK